MTLQLASVAFASLTFGFNPAPASSEPVASESTSHREIYFEPQHVGLLSISLLSGVGSSIPQLSARPTRWVNPGRFDRRAREALNLSKVPGKTHTASAVMSDVFAFGVVPGTVLASGLVWRLTGSLDKGTRQRHFRQDLAVVGEAMGLTLTAVSVLKIGTGRRRPFVWAAGTDPDASVPSYRLEPDQNGSFPSGHSALAVAAAVSGSTVASIRRVPYWRLTWLSLIPAVTASFLRVAADKHYLSDAMIGAAIGAGIGVFMPLVVHNPGLRKRGAKLSVSPFHRGLLVGLRW